jgi:hypothetical protein
MPKNERKISVYFFASRWDMHQISEVSLTLALLNSICYLTKLHHRSPFSILSIDLIETVLGILSQNKSSISLYSFFIAGYFALI